MPDILRELVAGTRALLAAGYYDQQGDGAPGPSLVRALERHPYFPIIAEVKLASPSRGVIANHAPEALIDAYVKGGAAGLSVLTEPRRFGGSLDTLAKAASTGRPVLMKDFVIDERQLRAGASRGASAVLLIQKVFAHGLAQGRDGLIELAHAHGLEVVLEAGDLNELGKARGSEADVIGINQRDLSTMSIDASLGERLLVPADDRPVVVMSAIERREQVMRLRDRGATAVLVGSSLSSANDPNAALAALAVPR